jgi:NAD(P)-dependent dehydrogenase (short-subunit alcohol dehydrogenase family)
MTQELAVIVGAGPGIGAAATRRFAEAGHRVAVLSRSESTTAGLLQELRDAGRSATAVTADSGDGASLAAAFAQIRTDLGDPTVLLFNALAFVPGAPTQLDLDAFEASLRANVVGALACVDEVVPAMRAAGRGTILLTGGGMALQPVAKFSAVSVAKAAQRSLFLSLAEELAPDGIHVAQVTVAGFVKAGGPFDPALIAVELHRLHAQPPEAWETEVVFDGA